MVIGFATKLVKTITFSRVLLWTLAAIVGIAAWTSYEHRDELFQASPLARPTGGNVVGEVFKISDETKTRVKQYVKDDEDIVGLSILSADIRLNTRISLFFYGDGIDGSNAPARAQVIDRLPLFTRSDENNRQIVKLINGEFSCAPYAESTLAHAAPDINKDVVTICRASLPPYYGHFSGFVTVFLRTDPDVERQVRLKNQLEQLATEIYFRDVVPTTHKAKL